MVWEQELEDVARREALAAEMGGSERVQRQRDSGRLTVRERLGVAGDAGSFTEIGGLAGQAAYLAQQRVAWPRADWGSLPVEGGIEAAYRRDLGAADDPDALRAEIHARMEAVRSPLRTAEVFGIERIIDPADTRRVLTEWVGRVPTGSCPTTSGRRRGGYDPELHRAWRSL